jgi:hypothetical protein
MRIVEEDMVDWEPLRMRFVFTEPVVAGRREALVAFIDDWFGAKAKQWLAAREVGAPPEPLGEYCGANIADDVAVEAFADLIPIEWLQELTEAVELDFADVDHLRLGVSLTGPTDRSDFEWVHIPRGEIILHGNAVPIADVDISLHHVSLGQFEEFMRETGYRPVQDQIERDGALVGWLRINFGPSPKIPVIGVTYGDAVAFCDWASLRLPSEAELYAFFLSTAREDHQFEWSGECWTTDVAPDGTVLACEGPYTASLRKTPQELENRREYLAADHYDYPWIGFRVAKSA